MGLKRLKLGMEWERRRIEQKEPQKGRHKLGAEEINRRNGTVKTHRRNGIEKIHRRNGIEKTHQKMESKRRMEL